MHRISLQGASAWRGRETCGSVLNMNPLHSSECRRFIHTPPGVVAISLPIINQPTTGSASFSRGDGLTLHYTTLQRHPAAATLKPNNTTSHASSSATAAATEPASVKKPWSLKQPLPHTPGTVGITRNHGNRLD